MAGSSSNHDTRLRTYTSYWILQPGNLMVCYTHHLILYSNTVGCGAVCCRAPYIPGGRSVFNRFIASLSFIELSKLLLKYRKKNRFDNIHFVYRTMNRKFRYDIQHYVNESVDWTEVATGCPTYRVSSTTARSCSLCGIQVSAVNSGEQTADTLTFPAVLQRPAGDPYLYLPTPTHARIT